VATIETKISQEQNALDLADEQYNQAVVNLTGTQASLRSTLSAIAAITATLSSERSHLRGDAIEAYIGDTSSAAVAEIFAAPTSSAQISSVYQKLGAGNVARDVAKVQVDQQRLGDTKSKLLSEQQAETTQLTQENQARSDAAAASALSEATLAQVQGTLAQEIAQQAAAQAAIAAQTASSATTPGAAQAAAAAAAQAAQYGERWQRRGRQCGDSGKSGCGFGRRRLLQLRRQSDGGRSGGGARCHEVPGRSLRVGWIQLQWR
jgi:hypothetical protein